MPEYLDEAQEFKHQLGNARTALRSMAGAVATNTFKMSDDLRFRFGLTAEDVAHMATAVQCVDVVWERLNKWFDDERLKHIKSGLGGS